MSLQVEPLVTIFAICHNHEAYVLETLESIRAQTYKNIQLIIINNSTNDNSGDIITGWIDTYHVECEFIQNAVPLTLVKNCNLGLSKAKGKYFQGISCDDIMMPDKISWQVQLFEQLGEEFACVYADAIKIDKHGKQIGSQTFFDERKKKFHNVEFQPGSLHYELQRMCYVVAPTVLLRKSSVLNIQGYDEKFLIEDWPLWIKLSAAGHLFYPLNKIVAKYRIHPESFDQVRAYGYYRSILNIYNTYHDFFNGKQREVRNKWFAYLKNYRKSDLFNSIPYYLKYLRFTGYFSLKEFVKYIINYR